MKAITYSMKAGLLNNDTLPERAAFLEYVRTRIHQTYPGFVVSCRCDPELTERSRVEVETAPNLLALLQAPTPDELQVWIEHGLLRQWQKKRDAQAPPTLLPPVVIACPHCGHELTIAVAMRGAGGSDPDGGS